MKVSSRSNQLGVALILVLWVITLLTIMAGSFALSIRRESSVISSIRDGAEASSVASAGIVIAQQMLLNPVRDERWLANGEVYSIEYADSEIRIQVYSEQGKININKANKKLLKNMIKYFSYEDDEDEQAKKIADSILDWRDSNSSVRLDGAEKDEYADEGLQYEPRNKPFQSIEELQLVLGMESELYRNIEPMITIFSTKATPDENSASQEVLYILDAKTAEDQERDFESLQNKKQEKDELFDSEKKKPATTIHGAFTVISEARLINGAKSTIKAIIKRQASSNKNKPFSVVAWAKLHGAEQSLFEAEVE